ncbi:hypothetical protein [Brevibacterium casei]
MAQADSDDGDDGRVPTTSDHDGAPNHIPFPDVDSLRTRSWWSTWLFPKPLIDLTHAVWVSFAVLLLAAVTTIGSVSLSDVETALSESVTPGTFTPVQRECSDGWRGGEPSCSWLGTYTDDDGTTIDGVLLDEELTPSAAGVEQRVRWNGDREEPVVVADDRESQRGVVILIVTVWTGVAGTCVYIVIRSHRRRKIELVRLDRANQRRSHRHHL